MSRNDETVLSAIARGDHESFAQLYHEFKDQLLTAAVHLLAGDRPTAEDVVHDVFVSVARNASSITIRTSLKSYLLAACLNRARDVLRKRARSADFSEDTNLWPAPDEPAGQVVAEAENRRRVHSAVNELPAEQREVVTLKIHSQLTFREIGEVLGISINTVQSRYRYALEKLKTVFVEEESHRGEQS